MIGIDHDTRTALDTRLRAMLSIHLDPDDGAPWWLRRQEQLGFDVRTEIRTLDDLPRLGPMNEDDLATLPIEEFLPSAMRTDRSRWILAETGGSLGRPKTTVHRDDEFKAAFVQPFLAAADRFSFPRGGGWLFVGPTGPHIIGRAARACARATGGGDVFSVDFDPRWSKKLPAGSFAANRYLQHVVDQATDILAVQRIAILFSTPPVLARLANLMSDAQRRDIRGIHFGGMAVSSELRAQLSEAMPHAVQLSGYGNALFGMMPELSPATNDTVAYFPHGLRYVVQVVADDDLARPMTAGQTGRVVVHRLDEGQLLLNVVERDQAELALPPSDAAEAGFVLPGLSNPRPIITDTVRPALGLY
jgi:thienamycin biosynthesis protein ThnN